MTHDITPKSLINQLHEKTAQEARARVQAYIALQALHIVTGGFENDEDAIEGKNS